MLGQRRYERVPFFCPLQLTSLKNGVSVRGSACDISIGGVGLTAPIALARGQPVCVRFYLHNGTKDEVEDVMGQVAYMRADEDGNRMGIEFNETLKEAAHPLLAKKINNL